MSYNGTVRCSYCHATGHNRRTCPKLKKQIEENPDGYYARIDRRKKAFATKRRCGHCGETGHNKRTCLNAFSSEATRAEKRAAKALSALLPPPNKNKKVSKPLEDISSCQNIWKEPKDYYTKQKCRENTCATCGGKGHNSRTCLLSPPTVIPTSTSGKKHKKCGICGEFGHNSRTCLLKLPEKKHKKCGICGELGHNSRTCNMKCRPCSVQSPAKTESITFANGETINLGIA